MPVGGKKSKKKTSGVPPEIRARLDSAVRSISDGLKGGRPPK